MFVTIATLAGHPPATHHANATAASVWTGCARRAQSLPQALQMPPERLPVTPTPMPTPHPVPELDPPDEVDPTSPPEIIDPSLPGERAPVRDPQPLSRSHGPH